MIENILKKAINNREFENFEHTLYVIMVEWGWSYEQFQETPIPVLMSLLKTHHKVNKFTYGFRSNVFLKFSY